jgi:hypothetical protein
VLGARVTLDTLPHTELARGNIGIAWG